MVKSPLLVKISTNMQKPSVWVDEIRSHRHFGTSLLFRPQFRPRALPAFFKASVMALTVAPQHEPHGLSHYIRDMVHIMHCIHYNGAERFLAENPVRKISGKILKSLGEEQKKTFSQDLTIWLEIPHLPFPKQNQHTKIGPMWGFGGKWFGILSNFVKHRFVGEIPVQTQILTLDCITLHYITLHYITYIHTLHYITMH